MLDALETRGIDVGDLADKAGIVDSDPVDALVHLAWNLPLATRTDRIRRVRKAHADFFEDYRLAARDVLAHLLDKYAGARDQPAR